MNNTPNIHGRYIMVEPEISYNTKSNVGNLGNTNTYNNSLLLRI